jgi:uncharacterized protein
MHLVDGRTGLEVIERDECLRLLGSKRVGRLAVAAPNGADVFPVNYALDGDRVVFRTGPGTKLNRAERAQVAFEIDHTDEAERLGWSVVVHGFVDSREGDDALRWADEIGVEPWHAPDQKPHVLVIVPTTITGRRILRDG